MTKNTKKKSTKQIVAFKQKRRKTKAFLRVTSFVVGLALLVGATSFGFYALFTGENINYDGYSSFWANAAQVEQTIQQKAALTLQLEEKEAARAAEEVAKDAALAEVAAKNAELAQKEALIAANNAAILALQEADADNQVQIAALEAANALLQAEVLAHEDSISALTADIALLDAQLIAANESIATLQADIALLEAQILNLNTTILQLQNSLYELGNFFTIHYMTPNINFADTSRYLIGFVDPLNPDINHNLSFETIITFDSSTNLVSIEKLWLVAGITILQTNEFVEYQSFYGSLTPIYFPVFASDRISYSSLAIFAPIIVPPGPQKAMYFDNFQNFTMHDAWNAIDLNPELNQLIDNYKNDINQQTELIFFLPYVVTLNFANLSDLTQLPMEILEKITVVFK